MYALVYIWDMCLMYFLLCHTSQPAYLHSPRIVMFNRFLQAVQHYTSSETTVFMFVFQAAAKSQGALIVGDRCLGFAAPMARSQSYSH